MPCERCGAPTALFSALCWRCNEDRALQKRQTEASEKAALMSEMAAHAQMEAASKAEIDAELEAHYQHEERKEQARTRFVRMVEKLSISLPGKLANARSSQDAMLRLMASLENKLARYGMRQSDEDVDLYDIWLALDEHAPHAAEIGYNQLRRIIVPSMVEMWNSRATYPASPVRLLQSLAQVFVYPDMETMRVVDRKVGKITTEIASLQEEMSRDEECLEKLDHDLTLARLRLSDSHGGVLGFLFAIPAVCFDLVAFPFIVLGCVYEIIFDPPHTGFTDVASWFKVLRGRFSAHAEATDKKVAIEHQIRDITARLTGHKANVAKLETRCKVKKAEYKDRYAAPDLRSILGLSTIEKSRSQNAASPPPLPPRWYYAKEGQRVGPISLEDMRRLIKNRQLKAADVVLKEGDQVWTPASSHRDLFK